MTIQTWKCPSCNLNNLVSNSNCINCGCYPSSYGTDRYRDDLYGPRVGSVPWYTKVGDLFTKKDK